MGSNGGDTLVVDSPLMRGTFTLVFRGSGGSVLASQTFTSQLEHESCCGSYYWDTMSMTIP